MAHYSFAKEAYELLEKANWHKRYSSRGSFWINFKNAKIETLISGALLSWITQQWLLTLEGKQYMRDNPIITHILRDAERGLIDTDGR